MCEYYIKYMPILDHSGTNYQSFKIAQAHHLFSLSLPTHLLIVFCSYTWPLQTAEERSRNSHLSGRYRYQVCCRPGGQKAGNEWDALSRALHLSLPLWPPPPGSSDSKPRGNRRALFMLLSFYFESWTFLLCPKSSSKNTNLVQFH